MADRRQSQPSTPPTTEEVPEVETSSETPPTTTTTPPPVEEVEPTPPVPEEPPPPTGPSLHEQLADAMRQLDNMTKRAQEAELGRVRAETTAMEARLAVSQALTMAQQAVTPPEGVNFYTDAAAMDRLVAALNKSASFRDNHRVDTIREDGVPAYRWEPYHRPYTVEDIIAIRESDEGISVVTGDGQKRTVQL